MNRILFNFSNIKIGGGLQVSLSILDELSKLDGIDCCVIVSNKISNYLDVNIFPDSVKFFVVETNPSFIGSFFGKNTTLDTIELSYKPHIVFSLFGPTYWRPKATHIVGFAKAQYVYKLESPFFGQLTNYERLKLRIKEFVHLLDFKRNSDVLITENEDVSIRIGKLLNKKVFTVSNSLNTIYQDQRKWSDSVEIKPFNGVTLLVMGSNYPHKNFRVIPDVIKELKSLDLNFNFRFLITVDKSDMAISDKQILQHIEFIGEIRIDECPNIYQKSDFLIMPTLLETFSVTFLEAMFMKVPILTSNLPFIKSICDDGAEYFDPMSPSDIALKVNELVLDENRKKELIERAFKRFKNSYNSNDRLSKYFNIISNEANHTRS